MKKTTMAMCAVGGATGAIVLTLGILSLQAMSSGGELAIERSNLEEPAKTMASAPVAPTDAALKAIAANKAVVDKWLEESFAFVSRGDMAIEKNVSPERFKQTMLAEAAKMSALPGGNGGHMVREGFGFAFSDYIVGGAMPEIAKLPLMQRRWEDVKFIVETMSAAGVAELLDITAVEETRPREQPRDERPPKNKRKAKQNEAQAAAPAYTSQTYDFKFLAKPAAMTRFFNALASAKRFVAADSFSFGRETDDILESVADDDAKDAALRNKQSGGRKAALRAAALRREAAAGRASETREGPKSGIATDPMLEKPLLATMRVLILDFGTAERKNAPVPNQSAGDKIKGVAK